MFKIMAYGATIGTEAPGPKVRAGQSDDAAQAPGPSQKTTGLPDGTTKAAMSFSAARIWPNSMKRHCAQFAANRRTHEQADSSGAWHRVAPPLPSDAATSRCQDAGKPSTRLSQEPCLGVKVNSNLPADCSANQARFPARHARNDCRGSNGLPCGPGRPHRGF
jgi:hypothetical protein